MRSTRSLTVALFTAAIALAACGKKDDGKAKAPPAPTPEAKPTPPAPTPTPLAPTIEALVGFRGTARGDRRHRGRGGAHA